MTEDTLEARAEREIVELHELFQGWFRGELEGSALSRLEMALAGGFTLITPEGRALDRASIISGVRSQHGSDPRAELWIEKVAVRQAPGEVTVVTYEEWQGRHGSPPRGRLSTVVFAADPGAAHGLVWLHVHETWLAGPAGS